MTAPTTVPTPPCTAAPPMNTAAMASSSKLCPAEATADPARAVLTTPASPASSPMFTKMKKLTQRVLTPDIIAANRLPPIAYTCRPKTVRVRRNE